MDPSGSRERRDAEPLRQAVAFNLDIRDDSSVLFNRDPLNGIDDGVAVGVSIGDEDFR